MTTTGLRRSSGLLWIALVAVGVVVGYAIALTSAHRGSPAWLIWSTLATALTGTAGAVCGYGLLRWSTLAAIYPVRPGQAYPGVAAILGTSVVLLVAVGLLGGRANLDLRGLGLSTVAMLGALPAAAAMAGIRVAALAGTAAPAGAQAARLIALRRLLPGLLAALGALVALSTVALGAGVAMGGDFPRQGVIVFGAGGSLLVGLFYVPAATAVRDAGQQLCDTLLPLAELDGTALIARAEQRQKFEQVLGADRSQFQDLQSGIVILGPLLASAAAVFLPH